MSVILILLLPLIATALVCLPLKRAWASGVTVVSSLATLILSARLAWLVSAGNSATTDLSDAWHKWIAVDGLSALILVLIAFVATTAAIFSVGYMAHGNLKPGKLRLYYINYNLFVFSMLAIPVLAEPTLVWIVVELTTLCSALLVSFENTREALEAAWKYVVLSLMGAGFALFGFLVLFAAMQASGNNEAYTWSGLIDAAPMMPPVLLQMAFLLILIGLGTKVGLVPMHTWLPDAHSQAPSPVCALLSGIETTSILYVILRLFPVMQAAPHAHAETWAVVLGLISVGTAAFLLLQVRDYKRMFAFSTVEHMGIILTAVGLGASIAGYGAMQQIVSHCVAKSFCFFAAGALLLTVETRQIASIRGLIRQSPFTSAALVFGGLAITGAPPLAVFLSEFSILKAGLTQKEYLATGLLALFIVIAFFGIMLHVNRMVFGARENEPAAVPPDNHSESGNKLHLPFSCRLALILAAVPVLLLGFYIPQPLHNLLTQAAAALTK
ncbi:MAG TPA: proton-conducting transporter membrane subunit [Candidatus Saccharimonadales bacterium]|nr:proton-conducting transporter membrane subunit [Candidatus Saccharimonadales bacterium]